MSPLILYSLKSEIKSICYLHKGETIKYYLIAHLCKNKISGAAGYLLYMTGNIERWYVYEDTPFINAILFDSPEKAFEVGEEILKATSLGTTYYIHPN